MCANPEDLWITSAYPASPLWIQRTFHLFGRCVLGFLKLEAVEKDPVKKSW
jgi:hypothetical protein